MSKLTFTFLVLLISAPSLFSQEHNDSSIATQKEWFTYTSAEGSYTVSLSEQPKLTSQNITAASGDKLIQYMASAPVGVGLVMVGYFDYPNNVVFSLDEARNGMVNSLQGTLLDEESISLGGSPGRQLKIAAKTATGADFIDRARFYDVSHRIYVLQCLFAKSDDGESPVQMCDRFFDSFKAHTRP